MRLSSLAVAAVVVAALVSGCAGGGHHRAAAPIALVPPTLSFRSATPVGFDFEAATFLVAFDVTNPNPVTLPLARLSLVMEVEGAAPFAIEARPNVAVAASSSTPVAVPLRVRYADIPNVVAMLGLHDHLRAHASGSASVQTGAGLLPMPVAFDAELPLPRPPLFAFEGVSIDGMSALGMSFDVKLRVTNPNPFPIPAGRLGYILSVAGTPAASAENQKIPGTPAGGSSGVSIRASVSLVGAGVGAGKAIFAAVKGSEVPVGIRGQASLGGIPLPLELETRIPRIR
jgi:LEA14-like dessication related protein